MRKNEKKSWEVKFGLRFILEKCERCMPAGAAYGSIIKVWIAYGFFAI